MGTPLYMSPEVIRDPEVVDARSDLYALGAVGYFLLSGRHVFEGKTVLEVCTQHLIAAPIPPSIRIGRSLLPSIENLILSCLAKDPAALENAFEAIEEAAGKGAAAAGEEGTQPSVCLSWRAAGRWLSLAVSDCGSGLRGDVDPFLPFVTTKPNGSGVGLALCREVADAHGGRVELESRSDRPGCRATLTLPLAP